MFMAEEEQKNSIACQGWTALNRLVHWPAAASWGML
jgi:hypothetical protein